MSSKQKRFERTFLQIVSKMESSTRLFKVLYSKFRDKKIEPSIQLFTYTD